MSVFKTYSSITSKEDKRILKMITKSLSIPDEALKSTEAKPGFKVNPNDKLDDIVGALQDQMKSKSLFGTPPPIPPNWKPKMPRNKYEKFFWDMFEVKPNGKDIDARRANILTCVLGKGAYFLTFFLASRFVNLKLRKFAISKINERFRNGRLARWFDLQAKWIYTKNPQYSPITIEEYKKSKIMDKLKASWIDKTKAQRSRKIDKMFIKSFFNGIMSIIGGPFAYFYSIAGRILLSYLGIYLPVGAITTIPIEYNGNCFSIGICITRLGCELLDPEIIVKKSNGQLVQIELPQVPRELYRFTEEEAEIVNKKTPSLEELKKAVERNHGN